MRENESPIRKFDKMCHFGNKYIAVDMPHERDTGKVLFVKSAGMDYVLGGSYDLEMCLFFADLIDHINELQQISKGHIEKLVEAVENQAGQDLKPMWDKWQEEMTKQIKETLKGDKNEKETKN